jgi:hypothetical protein
MRHRVRNWPMAEATTTGRGVRLQPVNLPSLVNSDSAHRGPRHEVGGASIIPPDATGSAAIKGPPRSARRPMRETRRAPRRAVAPGLLPVARSAARPFDAGTVASGAGTKPGEPGEALHREPLDGADVPLDLPRCCARSDAGDVSRPSTCRTAAPGPMPVVRSAATRCRRGHGGQRLQDQARRRKLRDVRRDPARLARGRHPSPRRQGFVRSAMRHGAPIAHQTRRYTAAPSGT